LTIHNIKFGYIVCYFLIVNLCFVHTRVYAQNFEFEQINVKNGLPSNNIYQILKDSKGYLWISTNLGLVRYDGYVFENFGVNSKIDAMAVSSHGNVWFSTNKGLFYINENLSKPIQKLHSNLSDSLADNDHFESLFIDKNNWIWSTDFHHIKVFKPNEKKITAFQILKNNTQNPKIAKFAFGHNKQLWAINHLGLCRFNYNLNKWVWYLKKKNLSSIYYDTKNSLWYLGDSNGRIFSYHPVTKILEPIAKLQGKILEIEKKENSLLALSPYEVHEISLQPNHTTSVITQNLEPNLEYRQMYVLNSTTLFLATEDGLYQQLIDNQTVSLHLFPKEFNQNKSKVMAISKLNQNSLLFGLDSGHLILWNKTLNSFKLIQSKSIGHINQIITHENTFYICTDRGLFSLNNHRKLQLLLPGDFKSLSTDNQNRIWLLSSNRPIVVFDIFSKQTLTPWKKLPYPSFFEENLLNKIIYCNHKMWIAAWLPKGFGILFFDLKKGEFVQLSDLNPHQLFVSDYYLNVFKTNDQNLYFSAYGGFNQVNAKGNITSVYKSDDHTNQIPDNQYFNIAKDPFQNIWVGTHEGLAQIKPDTSIKRYTQYDGLNSNVVTYGFYLDSNYLYLGSKNGFNIVKTNDQSSANKPKLYLSHLKILGEANQRYETSNLILKKANNNINIAFTTLTFEPKNTYQFQYRMKNIHSNWIEIGSNPEINLVNLDKGKYQLELAVVDHNANSNSENTIINFEILPAWYETPWFRIALSLCVLGLLFLFYRQRLNQLKKVFDIRNRISADLHDEIGASLSSIGIISGLLKQNLVTDKKNIGFAEIIAEEAKKTGNAIDYIIWNINPKFDSLESLFAKINKEAAELIEAQNMQYEFESNSLENKNLSLENKRNLYLILKELINNSLKHSKAHKISLHCTVKSQQLHVIFADNGCGFDKQQPSSRNGIVNINSRIKTMKGTCKIISKKDIGTTYQIKIPLK
jgi:signal transduction histidine kinase/ligand-binding sensor domain-containing protein